MSQVQILSSRPLSSQVGGLLPPAFFAPKDGDALDSPTVRIVSRCSGLAPGRDVAARDIDGWRQGFSLAG